MTGKTGAVINEDGFRGREEASCCKQQQLMLQFATITFQIKILGALSVGDVRKALSPPCCLPKIIIWEAIKFIP